MTFKAFRALPKLRLATASQKSRNYVQAKTTFSDSGRPVIVVSYKRAGRSGNGWVACLYKITDRKYRFRLYSKNEVRINTLTQTDDVEPYDVIKELVASINDNNKFKKYIHVSFEKESTSAFSTNVDFANGQTLRGGR